jgi:hypothetical protein
MMNEHGVALQVFVILSTVEMHTGGEPTRIIVGGWRISADALDKRRRPGALRPPRRGRC